MSAPDGPAIEPATLALAQAEASPDGLLVVDPAGRMVLSNPRFAEIWRLPDEVVSSGDDEAALEAASRRTTDPAGFLARVHELYRDPVAPARDEIHLVDGRVIDRYGTPLRTAAGRYAGWAWYFRDVTAEKQNQHALRELAGTLQATLLPPRRPEIPGMDVAARYRAADRDLALGGDFFDVFRIRTNEWGLVLGDVCGKGARAASLTALARYSVRSAAVHTTRASQVLSELNAVVLGEGEDDDRFCSAVFARLELDRCGAWLTLSCGGHPRPYVVRRAGWTDVRGQTGTLLGLFDDIEVTDDRVGLGPGDAIVLCTDGITEARDAHGEMFGEERLPATLLRLAGAPADDIADRLVAEALAFSGGRLHDDLAVLVVRVPADALDDPEQRLRDATGAVGDVPVPGYEVGSELAGLRSERPLPPREARIRLPGDERSASEARRFLDGLLHSWRLGELAEGDATLLLSEVTGNAVRHARSGFTVIVRWDGERLRVEVGDGSRELPTRREPDLHSTGGRGMLLVDQLASAWGVVPTVDGKRTWFEIPT